MTRLGLALAAAAALCAAPLAAHAQRATAPSPPAAKPGAPPPKLDAKTIAANKDKGAKEAPALLSGAGVQTCEIAEATYRGQGDDKDAQGKSSGKISAYEVACKAGPGYILVSRTSAPKPQAFNCIIAAQGATKCELAGNQDFKAALAPYVAQTGRACHISNVSYIGSSTTTSQTYYEVGCSPELGFRIGVSDTVGGPAPTVNDCLSLLGTPQACTLTTKEQVLAAFAPTVAKAGKTCQMADLRWIGRSAGSGDSYIEVACGANVPGFVLVSDAKGDFKQAIDCAKAQGIGEGCKMTDTTVAQNAEAGTYSKLAAKAGFPCQVKQYRFIGMDKDNREVVELACSDRPDGALGAFSEAAGKSTIYDCVRAPALGGTTCKLTQAAVIYPKYSEALAAKGRGTCKVSNATYLGHTQGGLDIVETACADGAPGWVVGFKEGTNTVSELLTCRQATGSGLPCKLPTNLAGNKGS